MEKKISIIVPVFNVESKLLRCVESILEQTYRNIEVILVDDGSFDNSGVICDEFAKCDNRVRVIHQNNTGPVMARYRGLLESTGEYIGFVDSDDYIELNMFKELKEAIEELKCDFVHTGYVRETKSDVYGTYAEDIKFTSMDQKIDFIVKHIIDVASPDIFSPSIWSKLYKASFIKKLFHKTPKEQIFGEDLLFFCRCILETDRFVALPVAFYHYQYRKDSLDNHINLEQMNIVLNLYKCFMKLGHEYNIWEQICTTVEVRVKYALLIRMRQLSNIEFQVYAFPEMELLFYKRVVLFGAGKVGHDYYIQFRKQSKVKFLCWIDSNPEINCEYCEVYSPQYLSEIEFDYIVIAVKQEEVANSIRKLLIQKGIKDDKILWKSVKVLI